MCRHCSADPSFRGFDLRVSPLGAPVVFTARRCLPFRRLPLGGLTLPPSTSGLPLGELAFGLTASAFRHAPLRGCPRRVGSSAFRFGDGRSAGWASGSRFGVALGELAFGLTASAFRHAPLRSCPRRVGLRAHGFRFSARTASEIALGGLLLPPSVSELPFGGLAFGLTASAFRHAPLRSGHWASSFFRSASWFFCLPFRRLPLGGLGFGLTLRGCPRRVGLRAHGFRFSARTASELPSAGWRFRLPFRRCRSASWPSGSLLPLFGTHRSAPPHRRSEDRRSTTTRHLFHFKTLIPTC